MKVFCPRRVLGDMKDQAAKGNGQTCGTPDTCLGLACDELAGLSAQIQFAEMVHVCRWQLRGEAVAHVDIAVQATGPEQVAALQLLMHMLLLYPSLCPGASGCAADVAVERGALQDTEAGRAEFAGGALRGVAEEARKALASICKLCEYHWQRCDADGRRYVRGSISDGRELTKTVVTEAAAAPPVAHRLLRVRQALDAHKQLRGAVRTSAEGGCRGADTVKIDTLVALDKLWVSLMGAGCCSRIEGSLGVVLQAPNVSTSDYKPLPGTTAHTVGFSPLREEASFLEHATSAIHPPDGRSLLDLTFYYLGSWAAVS